MRPAAPLDISVLIATRSRAGLLRETLESMCRLDTSGLRWELRIVDNGSTDDTAAVLDAYRERLPLRTTLHPEPGKNRALNAALGQLAGALTILTDDDVIVPSDWLLAWRDAAGRWPDDAVFGGRIVPRFPAGTPAWISSKRFPMRAQCFAAFEPRQGEAPYDGTAFGPNLAVRTALFQTYRFADRLGPTGTTYAMGGETEFLWRLRDAGYRIIYVPTACVEHSIESERLTEPALFHRARNAGRGDELRRALDRRASRGALTARMYLVTAPKILAYFVAYGMLRALPAPMRFKRGYKLFTAYGRWQQLRQMASESIPPDRLKA
jgi:GT2 family glycosyltransferase